MHNQMKVDKLLFGYAEVQPNFASVASKVSANRMHSQMKVKKLSFGYAEPQPNFANVTHIYMIYTRTRAYT